MTGTRFKEAFKTALAIQESLVRDNPDVTEYKSRQAAIYSKLGSS